MRHSFDSKTDDLRKADVKIIKEVATGRLGLAFKQCVHASMKNDSYTTEIAATKDNILISMCTCKAGGTNEEKVICVHSLVPLYQLTLLLTGGHMAEHLLVEFTNRWGKRSDESKLESTE